MSVSSDTGQPAMVEQPISVYGTEENNENPNNQNKKDINAGSTKAENKGNSEISNQAGGSQDFFPQGNNISNEDENQNSNKKEDIPETTIRENSKNICQTDGSQEILQQENIDYSNKGVNQLSCTEGAITETAIEEDKGNSENMAQAGGSKEILQQGNVDISNEGGSQLSSTEGAITETAIEKKKENSENVTQAGGSKEILSQGNNAVCHEGGNQNQANNYVSHEEANQNQANNYVSHEEANQNQANNYVSHEEANQNQGNNYGSHEGGNQHSNTEGTITENKSATTGEKNEKAERDRKRNYPMGILPRPPFMTPGNEEYENMDIEREIERNKQMRADILKEVQEHVRTTPYIADYLEYFKEEMTPEDFQDSELQVYAACLPHPYPL